MLFLICSPEIVWLLRRHAVSVLPSIASLEALWVLARKEQDAEPLIGFGDPIFRRRAGRRKNKRGCRPGKESPRARKQSVCGRRRARPP
jgi:hypothetical protein